MRIAVTGSSGFVGRHLCATLAAAGHEVTGVSRTRGLSLTNTECHTVANYTDVAALTTAFEGCDAVVHLAAMAHMRTHVDDAEEARRLEAANVVTAVAVAHAASQAGCARVVLVSSIGVNGNRTHGRPFTEEDPPRPQEPYARSKWIAEQRVADFLHDGPTDWVILRPPLVYGPLCPGNLRMLIGLVQRLPWVPLGSLHRMRSFISVGNLCSAILTAAQHPACSRRTFLVCDGEDLDIARLCRLIASGLGRPERRILAVPWLLLRTLALLAGRASTLDKLAAELQVRGDAFRKATGWAPPERLSEAVIATARSFTSSAVH